MFNSYVWNSPLGHRNVVTLSHMSKSLIWNLRKSGYQVLFDNIIGIAVIERNVIKCIIYLYPMSSINKCLRRWDVSLWMVHLRLFVSSGNGCCTDCSEISCLIHGKLNWRSDSTCWLTAISQDSGGRGTAEGGGGWRWINFCLESPQKVSNDDDDALLLVTHTWHLNGMGSRALR